MKMGIINFFKPPGMTSFDCVKEVRRVTGVKKVGHTGTLDPLACGVLPLCLGKATKLVPYLLEKDKVYRGEMFLGLETTTLDLEGDVVSTTPVNVEKEEILKVFSSFEGSQLQVPPLYSAKRVGGKRYYEHAREGRRVNITPVEVTVYYLKFLWDHGQRILFETKVSKGTYIRSLVRDIGERLGCGACLSFLIRTQAGPFSIPQTNTLGEVKKAFRERGGDGVLLPPDQGLLYLPAVHLDERAQKKVENGIFLGEADILSSSEPSPRGLVRIYVQNRFVAIYQKKDHILLAKKVFL